MTGRHFVLDLDAAAGTVQVACSERREPLTRERHTLLAAFATCPQCRVVQAARVILTDSENGA